MKASKAFEKNIETYLSKLADTDALFRETLKKPGKNITDCCTYICNEVKKMDVEGLEDDEVYGLAVHYYDEDDIEVGKQTNVKVVINQKVELTEQDKQEAKEQAMTALVAQEQRRMTTKPKPQPQTKTAKPIQTSLF